MKHLTLFILGIFLSFSTIGQDFIDNFDGESPQENNMNYFTDASSPGRLYTFQPKTKNVEGSPFLVEGTVNGKLFTADSILVSNIPFRYNAHEDCVEIVRKGTSYNLFAYKIKGFSFYDMTTGKNRIFVNGYKNYLDNLSPLSYYEVLYRGKDVKLLVKHNKPVMRVNSKINAPGINTNTATAQYSYTKSIYILDGDDFIPIKFNRASIMESIGNAKIRKFLKENKNKCRTAEEVSAVLKFYEALKQADVQKTDDI